MKFLILFLIILNSCAHKEAHHWSYHEVDSPKEWGKVSSDFKSCDIGHNQSPINLSSKIAKPMKEKITFNYHDSKTEVVDNGHTVKVEFKEDNYITIGKKKYHLDQLHFHTHSEHSIDGVFFPIEMHLVHRAEDGSLTVLAFFVDTDGKKIDRFGFFKGIPSHRGDKGKTTIQLNKLMKYVGPHYFYEGSLTTPPCTEGVHWVVFDKHIKLHKSQIEKFGAVYHRNYRPVQKTWTREVFHSSL